MNQPLPERTRTGPAYEGRLLPRPADEVVDQGLRFDVATLLSRRRLLGMLGVGAGAATLAACGVGTSTPAATSSPAASGSTAATPSAATPSAAAGSPAAAADLVEIPDETAGPYPGDGSNGPDALEESGIVRSDIRSSFGTSTTTAGGVPLSMTLTILDLANGGVPFVGVAVYVWHCDREGRYSMYSAGIEGENYLRGVQVADADGRVTFTSIFPACYAGRWPHVHLEVYPDVGAIDDAANAIATSQLAFPQNACDAVYATGGYEQSVQNLGDVTIASDGIFGDDGGAYQISAVTGDASSGYVATLTVPVDTATAPASSGMGGPGGPPGGGGPGGG